MQPKRTKQKFRLRLSWKLLASKSITTLLHSTLLFVTLYLIHIKPQSYVFFQDDDIGEPPVRFAESSQGGNGFFFSTMTFLDRLSLKPMKTPGISPGLTSSGTPGMRGLKHVWGSNPGVSPSFETRSFSGVKNEASTPSRLNLKELAREGTDSPRGQFLDLFFGSYIFTNSWYGKKKMKEWLWKTLEKRCVLSKIKLQVLNYDDERWEKGSACTPKKDALACNWELDFGGHVSSFVATERLFHGQRSFFAAYVMALEPSMWCHPRVKSAQNLSGPVLNRVLNCKKHRWVSQDQDLQPQFLRHGACELKGRPSVAC